MVFNVIIAYQSGFRPYLTKVLAILAIVMNLLRYLLPKRRVLEKGSV